MKKKLLAGVATGLLIACSAGGAKAMLTTIGTAGYDNRGNGVRENFKLIWDDDNNGNSIVWFDYSNAPSYWAEQNSWAAGLNANGVLTMNLAAGYSVDWGTNLWRLPSVIHLDSPGEELSEIEHLFMTELENVPPDGSVLPRTKVGDFKHLMSIGTGNFALLPGIHAIFYWSDTGEAVGPPDWRTAKSWGFDEQFSIICGSNGQCYDTAADGFGLAVRTGQVIYTDPNTSTATPIPGAVWLLGTGLAGLIGARRKKKA